MLTFDIGLVRHWQIVKRDVVKLGQRLTILVISRDKHNITLEFPTVVAVKQIGQAVVILRD